MILHPTSMHLHPDNASYFRVLVFNRYSDFLKYQSSGQVNPELDNKGAEYFYMEFTATRKFEEIDFGTQCKFSGSKGPMTIHLRDKDKRFDTPSEAILAMVKQVLIPGYYKDFYEQLNKLLGCGLDVVDVKSRFLATA